MTTPTSTPTTPTTPNSNPAAHTPGTPSASDAVSLSARLKAETRAQHDRAEHHPHQQKIMSGGSADAYRAMLGQMLIVHDALERTMDRLAASLPAAAPLTGATHRHLEALKADLAFLGATEHDTRPLPATGRFASWITGAAPEELLGVMYVLEGSTNGGTIIAKRLREAHGWGDERGTRFINPHGNAVRAVWAGWKTVLDGLPLSAEGQQTVVTAAAATFDHMTEVMTDLAGA